MNYADFGARVFASLIDGIIILSIYAAVFLIGFRYIDLDYAKSSEFGSLSVIQVFVWTMLLIVPWLYCAIAESSDKQGTIGKRAMGIKVTNLHGRRISFARASARHFASYVTSQTFLIGYLMAAFTAKKQTLHDLIAGTLVLEKR